MTDHHTERIEAMAVIDTVAAQLLRTAPETAALLQAANEAFRVTEAALRMVGSCLVQAEQELDAYRRAAVLGPVAMGPEVVA